MKHVRGLLRLTAVIRVGVSLVGVSACGPAPRDIERVPPLPRGPQAPDLPAPPVSIDDETELGAACPSALDACPPSPTAPCRVSCQAAADGCAEVWELFTVAAPPDFGPGWQAIDPEGEHGLFSWSVIDDDEDQAERFTWSAAAGIVSLSAAIGYQEFFDLSQVSDDASVAVGSIALDNIYWSREGGIQPIGVRNPVLARDGSIIAGQLGRRGVRWVRGINSTTVFEFENNRYASFAAGGAALFRDGRRLVYSPRAGEVSIIEAPADAPPDATFGTAVMSLDGASFVVSLGNLDEARVYRWANGALEAIDLLSRGPGDTQYVNMDLSADGRVLVAEVRPSSLQYQRVIRWSAATGTQLLSEDPMFYVTYVSPAGDVILGGTETGTDSPDERRIGLRWSVEDGMHETRPLHAPERMTLGGDVLVDIDADGPIIYKYGRAAAGTLPLEHLRGRLPPSRWTSLSLSHVAPTGRVLAGTAQLEPAGSPRILTQEEALELDARGELYPERPQLLWLARLRNVCPSEQ